MKLLKKLQIKDPEILRNLTIIGRLGLNIIISLLVFFLLFLWLDRRLGTGNILLFVGIIIGIFSGFYLNYTYLKEYLEDRDK
jgi:ATP synthase protein I